MKRSFPILIVLLLIQVNLKAQNTKSSASEITYILTDVSYISDAVFMGRRDSVRAPYILPSVGYYDKSGLFADASLSYLVSSGENRVDLVLLSAGYIFRKNRLAAGISGAKYFFDEESYNVQSEIEGSLTGMFNYDFRVAELTLTASGYFSDSGSTDVFTGLMLDRTFYAANRNLLVNPSMSIGAGSQYFYEQYYRSNRLGNRKDGRPGSGPGGGQMSMESTMVDFREASRFNLLNVEVGVSFYYFYKHFIFSFNPVWAFPQSGATITTDDGGFKEDLEDVFYWSVGISYWIDTTGRK